MKTKPPAEADPQHCSAPPFLLACPVQVVNQVYVFLAELLRPVSAYEPKAGTEVRERVRAVRAQEDEATGRSRPFHPSSVLSLVIVSKVRREIIQLFKCFDKHIQLKTGYNPVPCCFCQSFHTW